VPSFFPPLCWYFNFSPLGGSTEFVGGFLKASLAPCIYWYHTIFLQKNKTNWLFLDVFLVLERLKTFMLRKGLQPAVFNCFVPQKFCPHRPWTFGIVISIIWWAALGVNKYCFKNIFRWLLYGQSYIPDGNLRRDLCDLLTYWEIQALVDLGYFMIWECDNRGTGHIVFRNLLETIALLKKRQLLAIKEPCFSA
jgi:hypothetical protein